MRATTVGFSLIFMISVGVVLAMEFIAYPAAKMSKDPDRIEAPAFFLMHAATVAAVVSAVLVVISIFLQLRLKRFKASLSTNK